MQFGMMHRAERVPGTGGTAAAKFCDIYQGAIGSDPQRTAGTNKDNCGGGA